jgi:hypothetical protein
VGVAGAWLFVSVGALALGRRWSGEFVSPAALAVGVWAATVSLFLLRLVPYIAPGTDTWMFVAGAVSLLAGGLLVGTHLGGRTSPRRTGPTALHRARQWFVAYVVVGACGTVWYIWNVVSILGWAALRDGARIRVALADYTIPSEFLFLQFFCIAAPAVAVVVAVLDRRLRPLEIAGRSSSILGSPRRLLTRMPKARTCVSGPSPSSLVSQWPCCS